MRLTGETLALSPPLIINEAQIDQIFSTIGEAVKAVANESAVKA